MPGKRNMKDTYRKAMEDFLALGSFLSHGGRWLTRNEAHDRDEDRQALAGETEGTRLRRICEGRGRG